MSRVVILGAGGHARVLAEMLLAGGEHQVEGFLDPDPELRGRAVAGLPVLGADDRLPELRAIGVNGFLVGVGSVGDASVRERLFNAALAAGLTPVTIVHASATVSPSAVVGRGTVVLPGAIINTGAMVGNNVIVNSQAVVEHDCRISDHVHIATGAQLASGVHVEAGAHIGAGATVIQTRRVGSRAVVGAGSVVVRDVPEGVTVVGCPARRLPRSARTARGYSDWGTDCG